VDTEHHINDDANNSQHESLPAPLPAPAAASRSCLASNGISTTPTTALATADHHMHDATVAPANAREPPCGQGTSDSEPERDGGDLVSTTTDPRHGIEKSGCHLRDSRGHKFLSNRGVWKVPVRPKVRRHVA
jgi:hypothetical protein